ncbi:MAG: branched-chain alpha-keto acid dehydrogenase subunit E2, partial [Marinomonas sp.]
THEPSAALTVKTPRIGVIVSMIVALAWLGWLWSIPV